MVYTHKKKQKSLTVCRGLGCGRLTENRAGVCEKCRRPRPCLRHCGAKTRNLAGVCGRCIRGKLPLPRPSEKRPKVAGYTAGEVALEHVPSGEAIRIYRFRLGGQAAGGGHRIVTRGHPGVFD